MWIKQKTEHYHLEEHHNAYGKPWCLGLDHYRFIVEAVFRRRNLHGCTFLDFGCGSLRTGIHIIPLVRKYIGVDTCSNSISAAINYEIPMNRLLPYDPLLFWGSSEILDYINRLYDVIFCFSVLNHVEDKDSICDAFLKYSDEDTIIITSHEDYLSERGFELIQKRTWNCTLIEEKITFFVHKIKTR